MPTRRRRASAQRAAVIPSLDLWLEWRTEAQAMDTGADGGGVFARNDGLFVRRHNTMIDADLQSCDPLTEEEWKGSDDGTKSETGEIGRVTLRADRTLVLRTVGTLIQNTGILDPDASIPKMGFAVHFTGEAPPCERAVPRIATGLFGEWQFVERSRDEWSYDATIALLDALPESYTRRTVHKANGIENNDAVGCGSDPAPITLALGATDIAPLPSGWSFVAQPTAIAPGGYNSIGFGFGIADDAADADDDVCMVASTSSGMRSAKLFRLTLPESELNWYTNNRPSPSGGSSTYAGADPALVAACAALSGCDPSVEGCVEPRTDTCDLNLPCDSGAFDTEWGRCWVDGSGGGVRMRGRDSCAVEQSFCVGGLPLLESEACADPIDPPCADQASTRCSRVDPTVWSEILTPSGESTGCSGSYLCGSGGVAFGEPFCEEFHGSGDMKWSHPCRATGSFNAKCIQDACDAFEPCGGYMTTPDGSSYWLYGNDVSVQDWANANYQCWGPPLADDGSPSCSCLSGGIVPARPDSYECVDKSPVPSPPPSTAPSPPPSTAPSAPAARPPWSPLPSPPPSEATTSNDGGAVP